HPGHHLRVSEVLAFTADLPDPLVWLEPDGLEERHHRAQYPPRLLLYAEPEARRDVHRVHDLPVDVELALGVRRVADPHGAGSLVAGEPADLELGEPPLAADAVHDLELPWRARHGAEQPALEVARLLGVTRDHQR